MAVADPELTQLLLSHRVEQANIDHIAQTMGITTVQQLANAVDDSKSFQTNLGAAIQAFTAGQKANMKTAWLQAWINAQNEQKAKDDDKDDQAPVPSDTIMALDKQWLSLYRLPLHDMMKPTVNQWGPMYRQLIGRRLVVQDIALYHTCQTYIANPTRSRPRHSASARALRASKSSRRTRTSSDLSPQGRSIPCIASC